METEVTQIDNVLNQYVTAYARIDPFKATEWGISGYDAFLPDYSPPGISERYNLRKDTLARVAKTPKSSARELRESEGFTLLARAEQEKFESGFLASEISGTNSPIQVFAETFKLMDVTSEAGVGNLTRRFLALPRAFEGLRTTMRESRDRGYAFPQEALEMVLGQAQILSDPGHGIYQGKRAEMGDTRLSQMGERAFERGISTAQAAFSEMASFLQQEILPTCSPIGLIDPHSYFISLLCVGDSEPDPAELFKTASEDLVRLRARCDQLRSELGDKRAYRLSDLEIADGFNVLTWAMEDAWDAFRTDVDSELVELVSPQESPLKWENDPYGCLVHPYYPEGISLSSSSRVLPRKCAASRAPHAYQSGENPAAISGSAFDSFLEIDDTYYALAALEKGIPGSHLYSRARENYGANLFTRIAAHLPVSNLGWDLFALEMAPELWDIPTEISLLIQERIMRYVALALADLQLYGGQGEGKSAWGLSEAIAYLDDTVSGPWNQVLLRQRYLGIPALSLAPWYGWRHWQQTYRQFQASGGKGFGDFVRKVAPAGAVHFKVIQQML